MPRAVLNALLQSAGYTMELWAGVTVAERQVLHFTVVALPMHPRAMHMQRLPQTASLHLQADGASDVLLQLD